MRRRGRHCAKLLMGGTPRYGCPGIRCSQRCSWHTATRPTITTGNSVRDSRRRKSPRSLYRIDRESVPHRKREVQHRICALLALHVDGYTEIRQRVPSKGDV